MSKGIVNTRVREPIGFEWSGMYRVHALKVTEGCGKINSVFEAKDLRG